MDRAEAAIGGSDAVDLGGRAVLRAVVHHQDLPRPAELLEGGRQLGGERGQILHLVENRDDDGQFWRPAHGYRPTVSSGAPAGPASTTASNRPRPFGLKIHSLRRRA